MTRIKRDDDRFMPVIQRACAAVGIDGHDAVRLHGRANAVYGLSDAGAVVRLRRTHGSPEWKQRLATAVKVTCWLAQQEFPTTVPLDVVQPVTVDDWTATFWRYEREDKSETGASVTDLARVLRRLHGLPAPPIDLPETNPLGSLPADLEHENDVLTAPQRDWLRDRCAAITTEYPTATMPPSLGRGLLHGDAHAGNLLPTSGTYLLGDWDSVSYGPQAQDLIPTLHRVSHLGYPRAEWIELCSAYGVDSGIEKHPSVRLLQRAREIRSLAAYIRGAQSRPEMRVELSKRLRTLMTGEHVTWRAV
jgi:aminoglycoside phosphotransferase (APT) family kinase protein